MTKLAGSKPLVLILEDEVLIGINLQDELQDAGYEVAGPFTTCAAALEWLQTATPDAAILDAALKDGPCREIALELSNRAVPFLIYSGYEEPIRSFSPSFTTSPGSRSRSLPPRSCKPAESFWSAMAELFWGNTSLGSNSGPCRPF